MWFHIDFEEFDNKQVEAFAMTLLLFPRTPKSTEEYQIFLNEITAYTKRKLASYEQVLSSIDVGHSKF